MKSNVVLLLTGCINPNGMSYTKVADVETRLNQYIEALDFYSKNIKCPIVFVENSNFDIMPYIEKSHIDTSNIEVLSFYGNDYDKSIGKGFGEALIIEYALKHSTYVLSADIVIKITGRIILDDIARIVSEVSEASSNTVFADVNWHKDYHDKLLSVIVAASPKFWLRFISKKDEIDDKKGVVFEKVLKETADGWLTNGGGQCRQPLYGNCAGC